MHRAIIAMIALTLALASCGGDTVEPGAQPTRTSGNRISSTATLRVIEPTAGSTVSADSLPVRLELKGGRLVDKASTAVTPNTGHIHVTLDGRTICVESGLGLSFDLVVEKNGPRCSDPGPLTPGQHVLQFEYVAANHVPFQPRVIAAATVTVR